MPCVPLEPIKTPPFSSPSSRPLAAGLKAAKSLWEFFWLWRLQTDGPHRSGPPQGVGSSRGGKGSEGGGKDANKGSEKKDVVEQPKKKMADLRKKQAEAKKQPAVDPRGHKNGSGPDSASYKAQKSMYTNCYIFYRTVSSLP